MKGLYSALASAMITCASASDAQTAAVAPAAPAPVTTAALVPAAETPVLRIGTKVPLKLSQELTTKGKQLRVCQHFQMETTEPIMINGAVVVPVGSPATGEITEVRNKGMWGKSGHFTAQVAYVTVGGRQVRMTGTFDDKGTAGGIGAVAVSTIVFLPAGFFMTGTSAHLPAGAPVIGFIGEDVPLTIAAAPAPVVVPAPAVLPAAAPAPAPAAQPTVIKASVVKPAS